jgi:hypothetical protein
LSHQPPPPPRPQSTLSLNQLCFRRSSNPDIYPGARRFSTSYSHEDILSNDQLDQIHFDPRYRDYRSASSLNYSYNRSRSNSLNSAGSGGNFMQQPNHFRRLSSSHSPPLINVPLAPQKRWDTNPSIFIEEYHDEHSRSKTESRSEHHSKETLGSNESLQPLSECDIKSFGDLSQIPFIDDDPSESAPCRFSPEDLRRKSSSGIMSGGSPRNTSSCRKTVSFDVIAGGSSSAHHQLFHNNGKNCPKIPHSNPYQTDKNQLFHDSQIRANVRPSRDGINRSSHKPVPRSSSSSSCDDHCTLVDKLIRLKMEEDLKMMQKPSLQPKLNYKIKWDGVEDTSRVCQGKVKALTTYFNSLPYMSEDCNCKNVHQSTPDLSSSCDRNKLTCEEMEIVRRQLKEFSEFGLTKSSSNKSPCSFLEHTSSSPIVCLENEKFDECKQYRDVLNKLDKVEIRKKYHRSLSNLFNPMLPDCFYAPKPHHCHHRCPDDMATHTPQLPIMRSEKHKCRSPCYNIKDPAKKKKKKEAKMSFDDDNESFII